LEEKDKPNKRIRPKMVKKGEAAGPEVPKPKKVKQSKMT